jgi:hypothetical protein
MSLDYPYYEELRRRQHHAARWWLLGDRLYYLGLLPAVLAVAGVLMALLAGVLGWGWRWLLIAGPVLVAGVGVCVTGWLLKRHAYVLGERDGISAAEVYAVRARDPRDARP